MRHQEMIAVTAVSARAAHTGDVEARSFDAGKQIEPVGDRYRPDHCRYLQPRAGDSRFEV